MVSRNCTTSMSFRGNKKNNKPSRIVGHGLHYSTDKQNANSTHHSKNKSVLEKIKVGGKCIFKSQGIKDLSALREPKIHYSHAQATDNIEVNLKVQKKKKKHVRVGGKHSTGLNQNKTSDNRTAMDMGDSDMQYHTILQTSPDKDECKFSGIEVVDRDLKNYMKDGLFDDM